MEENFSQERAEDKVSALDLDADYTDGIVADDSGLAGSKNQFENEAAEDEDDSGQISFEDLGLDEIVLDAIKKKGFEVPSPIQVLAIPRLLNGEANVVARARTGTGKTAAFGLPLVQRLREDTGHVRAIILEPTRELAMQTSTEMESFTTGRFPRSMTVYGGSSYSEQIRGLKRGVEIVVGTPGRVQDLIDRGALDISKIEYFILDEGDEMLDMGFVEDIENIFSCANPDCRVLLFSATIPAPILKIAGKFMGDYEIVEEEVHEEPLLIEQKYWVVRESEKLEALVRLVDISPDFYGLVFVQKKSDADMVSKSLDEKGYQVAALHGDIPQSQREKILARFRSKKTRILVATDVAARGIDIEGLTHVVNYELPFDGPTYVHRIGRTGRAGAAGMAVTFVRPEEARRRLGFLRNAIKKSAKGEMTEGDVPSVDEVLAVKKTRLFAHVKEKLGLNQTDGSDEADDETESVAKSDGDLLKKVHDSYGAPLDSENPQTAESASENVSAENPEATDAAPEKKVPHLRKGDPIFDRLAEELCEGQNPQEVVASLLAATYGKELSKNRYGKINPVGCKKDGRGRERDRDRGASAGVNQIRLYVQMGWKDGYTPRAIADFFSDLLHIRGKDVDAIDMADKFCLLSLPKDAAERALTLSKTDASIPHIHVDSKSVSSGDSVSARGDFESRRDRGGRHGGRGRGRGERRFGGDRFERFGDRFGGDRFGGRDRFGDDDRRGRSKAKGGSHTRNNVHASTQRSSRGSAALFKKSGGGDEY